MNTLSLIHNFLNEEEDNFKENLSIILKEKIDDKKKNIVFDAVSVVFENEENLNIKKPNYDIIKTLKECDNQNSNIVIGLADGSESVLKPEYSRKVLSVFDNLNETNQVRLINRLVESRANFHNTIEFCIKFKGRYTQ
jgi:cellulose synthase/poly-beta-1,6-N-acetylglucosamine synthase-like glycosyltransferase|tara:strand:+ start:1525 stop:1938 length:414 start_codon:yes stop_codon:yes gene_type:complete